MRLRHVLAAFAFACGAPAHAQSYPAKPVRIVVPQAPGGSTDTQARLIGKKLQESLGQNFIVDNRPGANTLIGTEAVVRAPPDGYTMLLVAGNLLAGLTLHKKATFDPVKDLAPVSHVSTAPQFLVVHRSVPARNVKELVALAKKLPGKLNAGSSGAGGANHLSIELFKQAAGVDINHIPYKGSGPATIALMSGEVDMAFAGAIVATPYIQQGKLRALAITSAAPSPVAPGVPTLAASYPGFEATNWWGLYVPTGTPPAVINKLSAEVAAALKSPEVREFFTKDGAEAVGSTPEQLGVFFRAEVARYQKVVKAAGIRLD